MIQPQELRIGNYVEYNGEIKPVLSVDGERNDIEMGLRGTVTLPEYMPNSKQVWTTTGRWCAKVNPIPITPEILDKIEGFEKHPHFTITNSRFIDIGRGRTLSVQCAGTPNEMIFLSEKNDKPLNDIICIRNYDYDGYTHLHQLQNIIHSLTNKELTFKTKNNE